jgi:Alr-MurF fusion protein
MIDLKQYQPSIDESVVLHNASTSEVHHLVIDSRNIMYPHHALFFALTGNLRDGHEFLKAAYDQGVRNFVVSDPQNLEGLVDINYILTTDVVSVMQRIASLHRAKYPDLKVIGITGSNGKTVVKEWLSILLSKSMRVVKTPKSYNSQIGVPLSVWQINESHDIGIFEAGISGKNEMAALESIIKPTIGILTNIGDAHARGFSSKEDKLIEKLKLFAHAQYLIYNGDDTFISTTIKKIGLESMPVTWGFEPFNAIHILKKIQDGDKCVLSIKHKEITHKFEVLLHNEFFFENLMLCISLALHLGLSIAEIEEGIALLDSIDMRLQITEGHEGSLLINDAYTNDREALNIALPFLQKHAGKRAKILILSEFDNGTIEQTDEIIELLSTYDIDNIYLVGNHWSLVDTDRMKAFTTTDSLIQHLDQISLSEKIVLIKGARKFGFEAVYKKLVKQSHSVSLDIDLAAIENNLSVFASHLSSNTQIVPIIKASAYGTGSEEIAKILQHKGVFALGVAFADEGVQLRKSGIVIPIIVLNADIQSFSTIYNYNLEMEIYSLNQLKALVKWNNGAFIKKARIHLKFDTGMSRLGFQDNDINELVDILRQNPIQIETIFSHLSSSEDPCDDDFTHMQAQRFDVIYTTITKAIGYKPKRHLLNSSGIIRFPQYHYELVRLGLGLYGIDSTEILKSKLEKVHTLSAKIIQIKTLKIGDYVGYNRRHKVEHPMTIAVLNIGYADGLIRKAGNSNFNVLLQGYSVPIVGNICMDLTMIDITKVKDAQEGDDVILFGKQNPIEHLADVCNTIPYEILCRIAPRIKRNYLQ